MFKPLATFTLLLGLLPLCASAEDHVCFETNHGEICMRLYSEFAPGTVANFLRYVDSGRYDGTLIHRSAIDMIEGINIIQGGGFGGLPDNFLDSVHTDAPIALENSVSNRRGTIAMARGNDLHSATSQWFFNVTDNIALDFSGGGYAVFGLVIQGIEVLEHIHAQRRGDFSSLLGGTFASVPITLPLGELQADFEDFIYVSRAYRTPVLPYQCSADSPADTLTEYCGSEVRFPVSVEGVLYDGTMRHLHERPDLVFEVDLDKLRVLPDGGQPRATYTDQSGELLVPSVRIGTIVYDDVRLALTNEQPLEFTVIDFTER